MAVAAASLLSFANWNRYFVDQAAASRSSALTDIALLVRDRSTTDHVFLVGGDILRVGHGVVRFLAPDADARDLASAAELGSQLEELTDDGRGVLVVVLPAFADELEALEALHPGGRSTVEVGPYGEPWFTSYEMDRP